MQFVKIFYAQVLLQFVKNLGLPKRTANKVCESISQAEAYFTRTVNVKTAPRPSTNQ
jgi:hypothetical protein